MININNITVRIASKTLLEGATAHISDGQKVGLVGPNGCGKSTLFRVLLGDLETEMGEISFPSSYKVVSVAQEFKNVDISILDYVLAQDKELADLTHQLKRASDIDLPEIHERLLAIDAASAPARAASILSGLGFSNEDLTRTLREFSGGWRMRLALASALFQPSDILLLDEPTNHLDLESSIWLEGQLRRYAGTLLLITHDREILNSLCDHIVHFEGKKLISYTGNYDTFQTTRALQRELLSKAAVKQEARRKHIQSFIDRFRYKASKAKQAQSRIKMLAKMEEVPEPIDDSESHFTFPNPEHLSPPLVSLDGVSVGYGDHVVLRDLNLSIMENDRIALLGANGNGKSTFAKLLSNKLQPITGGIHRSSKVTVGYFAQHQAEELPMAQTPVQYMATLMPQGTNETQIRAHLGRFGLTQQKSVTQIEKLSGGEKARLLFAAVTYHAPALLILDEPTNHLDIAGRDALVDAVNEYTGSVVLITHDLNLIQLIADDLWLVKDGKCKPFDGDLEDYKNVLLGDKKIVKKESKHAPKNTLTPAPKGDKPSFHEIKTMKGQVARLEKKMVQLDGQKRELENAFLMPLSPEQIVATQKELTYLAAEIQSVESEWLRLSEVLEETGLK